MLYQTAKNTGTGASGTSISVGPIVPLRPNSYAVVACSYFSSIAAYGGWTTPGGQGTILTQQFAGQPSINNNAVITYTDSLNDEWAAVMAVYQTNGTPVWNELTSGGGSAFFYPSSTPHVVAVNQNDTIFVWAGVGTFLPSGQNGGDPGITVSDSDNNQYTFVKAVSGFPHNNVSYLFTAFNVNANPALNITVTGDSLDPPPTGPTGWSIAAVTNILPLPTELSFGSVML